jgi:two-component system, OmpR family, sensor kinase
VNPLRSVGARLSLALLVVVAGALGFVYLFVVPSLQNRLISAKLNQLERAAPGLARQLQLNPFDPNFVGDASEETNSRVVLYQALTLAPPDLSVIGDSRGGQNSSVVANDPLALQALLKLKAVHGTVTRSDERYAEVARPVSPTGPILLLSAPLHDTLATVHLVQRRVLLAGSVALLIALLIGYGGAWIFARRLRRLEAAAERIATGQFDEPIVDRGADEVGEVARAFDRMRLQLSQLEHARREFIANASHELRTPLFSLGGFLELLTDEELDEGTRIEFLTTMRDQVERLAKLATELLDLSRLDAGQLQVEREPVSLGNLARSLADEFSAVARGTGHTLSVEADEDEAVAIADEPRVLQIGRILLENAIRHTPEGTPVLITARSDGIAAVLAVEDEGQGIEPAHAAHVFERFYRAEGKHASGSGLGLAIGRELAQLMSGSLSLDSRPGRTVFTLRLPAAARFDARSSREPEVALH